MNNKMKYQYNLVEDTLKSKKYTKLISLFVFAVIVILIYSNLIQNDQKEMSSCRKKSPIEINHSNVENHLYDIQVIINIFQQLSEQDFDSLIRFQSKFNYLFEHKSLKESIILLRTLKLIAKDINEYDQELISFVQSLIVQPPVNKQPLNLENKTITDFSQLGQSIVMSKLMKNRTNGFFIEAGAHNGEYLSNSLYFERNLNWSGLLIEPITNSFQDLLSKHRNVFALNVCLTKNKPKLIKFKMADVLSGRIDYLNKNQLDYIPKYAKARSYETVDYYVPCFSLNTILKAIDVKNVDIFSLDVEGGEWEVLASIDYDQFNFDLFCFEWFYVQKYMRNIHELMARNGFSLMAQNHIDIFYQKLK